MTDINKVDAKDWRVALETCKDTAIESGAFESYKAVGEAFTNMELAVDSALAALREQNYTLACGVEDVARERDTLRTQLAEAQAECATLRKRLNYETIMRKDAYEKVDSLSKESLSFRNALVSIEAAESIWSHTRVIASKALKGDV